MRYAQFDMWESWSPSSSTYARKTDAGPFPASLLEQAAWIFSVTSPHSAKRRKLLAGFLFPAEEAYVAALCGAVPGEL